MKNPSRAVSVSGTLLVALWVSGCGTVPDEARTLAIGVLQLRANGGRVGLKVREAGPELSIAKPYSRQEAARVTSAGATKGTAASELALLFPVAFVMGGIEGMLAGTGEAELRRMGTLIEAAFSEFQPTQCLVEAVTEQLAPLGPGKISRFADTLSAPPFTHSRGEPAIETQVEVRTSFLGLQVYTPPDLDSTGDFNRIRHEHNPPLTLVWAVDVMAQRTRDRAAVGGVTARYESVPRRFRDWSANDAHLLRAELQLARQFVRSQFALRITVEPVRPTRAGAQSGDRPTTSPITPP